MPPNFIRFGPLGKKLQIYEILSCTSFVEWCFVVEKKQKPKNCNLLPNFLKLIKFVVIVQNDELNKILDYFSSAVFPLNISLEVKVAASGDRRKPILSLVSYTIHQQAKS